MQKKIFITLLSILLLLLGTEVANAVVKIPGASILEWGSIQSSTFGKNGQTITLSDARIFAGQLLGIARMIIAGFALIYIVFIGAGMILNSSDESWLEKQKKQILYAGIAFIFLNIPDIVYNMFMNENRWKIETGGQWTDVESNSIFWNNTGVFGVTGFLGDIVGFLKVIAFIAAVGSLVWGATGLIISRGKDEYREKAINRITYGIAGLIFLGIVEAWSAMLTHTDLPQQAEKIGGKLFALGFFFATPVAVFFLFLGAYYYITSAGNEERAKKWKNIFVYTLIAGVILIAGSSFLTDIANFAKNIF